MEVKYLINIKVIISNETKLFGVNNLVQQWIGLLKNKWYFRLIEDELSFRLKIVWKIKLWKWFYYNAITTKWNLNKLNGCKSFLNWCLPKKFQCQTSFVRIASASLTYWKIHWLFDWE